MNGTWDCIVIGAGAAGLSAALVLGRARRPTLLVDAGEQSNLAAEGVGGFLGADGMAPAAFYERSRAGLEKYPAVSLRAGSIVDGRDTGDGFELTTADGELVSARCILLATGMDYRAPRVPGIDERWEGPYSTARSVMAGRCVRVPWESSTAASRASTERYCCGVGATT